MQTFKLSGLFKYLKKSVNSQKFWYVNISIQIEIIKTLKKSIDAQNFRYVNISIK
jgi:hypothetical protein